MKPKPPQAKQKRPGYQLSDERMELGMQWAQAGSQVGWGRADYIADTCREAGEVQLMSCYAALASVLQAGESTVRIDYKVAQYFRTKRIRRKYAVLTFSYFRAAMGYEANPCAVLDYALAEAERNPWGDFASVDACHVYARKLRERDRGTDVGDTIEAIKLTETSRDKLATAASLARAIDPELHERMVTLSEDIDGIAIELKLRSQGYAKTK